VETHTRSDRSTSHVGENNRYFSSLFRIVHLPTIKHIFSHAAPRMRVSKLQVHEQHIRIRGTARHMHFWVCIPHDSLSRHIVWHFAARCRTVRRPTIAHPLIKTRSSIFAALMQSRLLLNKHGRRWAGCRYETNCAETVECDVWELGDLRCFGGYDSYYYLHY